MRMSAMRNDCPLQVDAQGLLAGCKYIPSPNFDDRSPGAIELLVSTQHQPAAG